MPTPRSELTRDWGLVGWFYAPEHEVVCAEGKLSWTRKQKGGSVRERWGMMSEGLCVEWLTCFVCVVVKRACA
jgi:hypothetical protein